MSKKLKLLERKKKRSKVIENECSRHSLVIMSDWLDVGPGLGHLLSDSVFTKRLSKTLTLIH